MGPGRLQADNVDVRIKWGRLIRREHPPYCRFKMKKITKNRKGFFFTIGIIILIIPLLFLISYYTESSKTRREDAITKIRCDELHYLVEDIERDMQRAVVIFGRRAAVYVTGWVIDNKPLANHTFNCNSNCRVDCDKFSYSVNGSEAAIAELVACGTLNGTNVTYMINHTLGEWINRIELHGREMHFNINISLINLTVVPVNAWEFSIIIWNNLKITDDSETCFYRETPIIVMSNTSITGLEDPLYPLNTLERVTKYISDCEIAFDLNRTAGCSRSGEGNGTTTGTVLLYSTIGNIPDLIDHCDNTPQETLGQQILVLDQAGGIVCNSAVWESCLNASHSKHFAGMIDYSSAAVCTDCPSTVPYVCNTGEMEDEIPKGGSGSRAEGCDEFDITNGTCVYIRNMPESGIHEVTLGLNIEDLNTSCYQVSNSSLYSGNCSIPYPDGPSFFDRLDGNYNLSRKYRDQANSTFGNPWIGIETIISVDDLQYYGIPVNDTASWIDYLYWKNSPGDGMCGVCFTGGYTFRMDCQHALMYNLSICS